MHDRPAGPPRYRVAIEVPHAGGWRARNTVAHAFERRLAAQASPDVQEPGLASETRRGSDVVRVRITMMVRAGNPGQAAVTAWDVFTVAAGEDAAVWDMVAASVHVQPLAWSVATASFALAAWCDVRTCVLIMR